MQRQLVPHRLLTWAITPLVLGAADFARAQQGAEGDTAASAAEVRGATVSNVRVMTQNLYIGLDVFPILSAPPEEVPTVVADAFADFVANRPEDRMAALANEIALTRPHLVGLQEVVRVFEQSPSDAVLGELEPNASDEVVDFLAVLLDELSERGVTYEVAIEQVGADIELPRFDGLVDGAPAFSDVRSRFSDVILRRAGVTTEPLFAINYRAALPVATLPGGSVPRNAVGVLARVGAQSFRFVSTHLEPLVPGLPDESQPQLAQGAELIELLATEHGPELPTIVVGDFNSPAELGATYQEMSEAGYADVWNARLPLGGSGLTCCQDVVLDNPQSALSERIDFIWTQNLELDAPVLAFTLGDLPFFRTVTQPRLWPSDHAGIIAALRF